MGDGFLYKGKLIAEAEGVNQRNYFYLYTKKKELGKVQMLILLEFILSQKWHWIC